MFVPCFTSPNRDDGRALAIVLTGPNAGVAYVLPYLSRSRWENAVLNPRESDLTIVALSDDRSQYGVVVVYVGQKQV